jgi:hypothetical protein
LKTDTSNSGQNFSTLESLQSLITLYEAWNKPEKAEEWRVKLPQTKAVEE